MNGRILTCVYCGHEYPQNTPSAGSEVLTEHIKVCPRHPMRKAEADIALLRSALVGLIGLPSVGSLDPSALLRSALVGLIGADTEQELREMEAMMRLLPAPEADKVVSINGIRALLATLPSNED